MQKLVTIFLEINAYRPKDKLFDIELWTAEKHGFVEEHLKDYLADGWAIKSLCALSGGTSTSGWLAVVLEKAEPHGSRQAEEGAGRQA